ncbi:hypothetical protein RAA17_11850 [Komagataeibacter rhaeticus]|nr:hypothetical protein [Komagataeibacter rhaeticus]
MFAAADDNPPGNRYNSTPSSRLPDRSAAIIQTRPARPMTAPMARTSTWSTGALLITELQYALNPQPADMSNVTKNPGLPGVYKLGGYYDTANSLITATTAMAVRSARHQSIPTLRKAT